MREYSRYFRSVSIRRRRCSCQIGLEAALRGRSASRLNRAPKAAIPRINNDVEGPYEMPVHIKAALLPVSLSIGVADGRMTLVA